MVMSGRSVNLTIHFLGRLRPPKRLTSTSCTISGRRNESTKVSNPGPLTYESGALPTAVRGPAGLYGGLRYYIQHYGPIYSTVGLHRALRDYALWDCIQHYGIVELALAFTRPRPCVLLCLIHHNNKSLTSRVRRV